ncbi:PspC domain-containing protein [Streptacidiphilus sp. P02-A3a]|uniref:PspC domain-containing protein n=1 Tax=Streptacidiphilus sp. P02-A3a TaxID=2704468 RepID=UPI0015FC2788|nr:PspC domain-containing protein [Streptacidiphilus sp. P02-A3a]QMU72672.1 PspC domain-containing protein [Streptacidiphilus sp. P02-A3a]
MTDHAAPPPGGEDPADAGPAPEEQPRPNRPPLKRSDSHRVVAGVCGGVGRHLDIDPVVFRVVIAVLCLSGGVGLFIYGMAWLIIPVERTGQNELQRLLSGKVDWQSLGAVLVTVLGTGIFFSYMGSTGHLFPLLLIALLAFAALRYDPDAFEARRRQAQPSAPQTPAAAAAVIPTDATTAPAPAWWQRPDPLLKQSAATAATAGPAEAVTEQLPPPVRPPSAPRDTVPAPPVAEPGFDWSALTPPERPEPPRPRRPQQPRRERSYLGTVFFCLAVITSGSVWLVGQRLYHGATLLVVLASGLLVLGLGLLLGARWGRARSLVLWAALLTLAVAAVAASPVQLRTTYQHVDWAPASAAAVRPSYRLSSGAATLDLTSVAPAPGRTVTTRVRLGAGALTVRLPSGPEIKVRAQADVGALELPDGTDSGGISTSHSVDLDPGAAAAHGTIVLDVSVGAGQVEVIQ